MDQTKEMQKEKENLSTLAELLKEEKKKLEELRQKQEAWCAEWRAQKFAEQKQKAENQIYAASFREGPLTT